MAKRKRTAMKRELAQAMHHLEIAQADIGEVFKEFDGVHEDYAKSLVLIGQSIDGVKIMIRSFWTWAWGKLPDNFDSYRC